MSGFSGPRVIKWLDKTSLHNDYEDLQCPFGPVPYPDPSTEFNDSGRQIAIHAMLYVPDTGDGMPGVLMVTNSSDGGGVGNVIEVKDATVLGPFQPDSVTFLVIQRVNPSGPGGTWPLYESFQSVGVGGEGFAQFYKGQIKAVVPCPTPDKSELGVIIALGGYPDSSGYVISLGDGTNYGWGIFMADESVFGNGLGTTKISDTNNHLLVVEVKNNNQITLHTDGAVEVLPSNGSAGLGSITGGQLGHSGVYDPKTADPDQWTSDDEYDAVYIKAKMIYTGQLTPAEIDQTSNYLKFNWHTV